MPPSGDWRFLPGIPVEGASLILSIAEVAQFQVEDQAAPYCLIALPDGWQTVSSDFWQDAYRLLRPGGVLYAGFCGRGQIIMRQKRLRGMTANPFQIEQQLQQAGFQDVTLYGALPNHQNPVFLFPLQPTTIHFALNRYFKKIPVVARGKISKFMSNKGQSILPAYAIIGSKQ
jgi:hypothetical protein